MKIGTRLSLSFGSNCLLLVLIIGIGLSKLSVLNDGISGITNNNWPKILLASQAIAQANSIGIALRSMMLTDDKTDQQKEVVVILEARKISQESLDRLRNAATAPEEKEITQRVADGRAEYIAGQERLMELVAAEKSAESRTYLNNELRPVLRSYRETLNNLIRYQEQQIEAAGKTASETYTSARSLLLILGAAALLLAAVIGYLITLSITRPLNSALKIAQTVAAGDLTSRFDVKTKDETGKLLQALRDMTDSLVRAVGELRVSEECFRGAFENAAIGMALADVDGRWTKVNHTLCKSLGYTEQQMLSKGYLDLTHPDDIQISATKLGQLLSGELNYYHLEKRFIHKNGQIVWTFVSRALVRDAHGTPLHYVGMIEDITERKQAEAALQLYQEKLHELVAHQERIKENERTRIAREIHDELGSVLTGVKANLSVAMHQDEHAGSSPNQRLLDACTLLDTAIDTVRKVITDLRPSVLDQLGVWAALEWVAEQTEARAGLSCRVSIDASAAHSVIDAERSTALFRIAQETLTNVARHADASQVEIRVRHEEGSVRMEVEDNGKGIDAAQIPNRKSWGIAGMAERARYFGGDIRITDTSHGTLVVLRLPLENLDG